MAKYTVYNKAFRTGEWYVKTNTDSKAAAMSVAKIGNWGRAIKVIDNDTNEEIYFMDEQEGCKELALGEKE